MFVEGLLIIFQNQVARNSSFSAHSIVETKVLLLFDWFSEFSQNKKNIEPIRKE